MDFFAGVLVGVLLMSPAVDSQRVRVGIMLGAAILVTAAVVTGRIEELLVLG